MGCRRHHRLDAESGLVYLRARYLEPGTGQFMSRDPLVAATRYGYTGGSPLNGMDPSGLCSVIGDLWSRNNCFRQIGYDHPSAAAPMEYAYEHRDQAAIAVAVVGGVVCLVGSAGVCAVAIVGGLGISYADSVADGDMSGFYVDAALAAASFGASRLCSPVAELADEAARLAQEINDLVVGVTFGVVDVIVNIGQAGDGR